MIYLYLAIAIVFEVLGTTALKETNGFTRLWPSMLSVAFYACAFYFLSLPMRALPAGIVYALWSGLGIVLITAIGWFYLGQRLDAPALVGLALILSGVLVINLFSKTMVH